MMGGSKPAARHTSSIVPRVAAFAMKTASLQRAVLGSVELIKETQRRIDLLKVALVDTRAPTFALLTRTRETEQRLKDLDIALSGDKLLEKYQEASPPSITVRVNTIVGSLWASTAAPTGTHERGYEIAANEFALVLEKLRALVETDLKQVETQAESLGAPWTPGRVPVWKKN